MSNGTFNFNFLVLLLSKILGGPNLHYGPYAPWTPSSGETFVPKASTFYFTRPISNGVFNFNFLALVLSEILGVPHLHYGPYAPWTPPSGNFFTQGDVGLLCHVY